jgi:hypothetical protein
MTVLATKVEAKSLALPTTSVRMVVEVFSDEPILNHNGYYNSVVRGFGQYWNYDCEVGNNGIRMVSDYCRMEGSASPEMALNQLNPGFYTSNTRITLEFVQIIN